MHLLDVDPVYQFHIAKIVLQPSFCLLDLVFAICIISLVPRLSPRFSRREPGDEANVSLSWSLGMQQQLPESPSSLQQAQESPNSLQQVQEPPQKAPKSLNTTVTQ